MTPIIIMKYVKCSSLKVGNTAFPGLLFETLKRSKEWNTRHAKVVPPSPIK